MSECKGLPIFHVNHNWEEISRRKVSVATGNLYFPYKQVLLLTKECSGCKEAWVVQVET